MPDIGLFELLVIGVLLFVVVGPERMPEFFGQIGRWVRHGRNWWSQMRGVIGKEIDQGTAPFQHAAGDIHQQINSVKQDVQRVVKDTVIEGELSDAPAEPSPETKSSPDT